MIIKKKNKKAWIKIAEAFISILLIIGVLMAVLVYQNVNKKNDLNEKINSQEISILNNIQTNKSLREDILGITSLPLDSNETLFPTLVKEELNNTILGELICKFAICPIEGECSVMGLPDDQEIFVKSVVISSSLEEYAPRKLNLFCYQNEV
ncbi:hypothetical protein HOD29_01980 [archaeon]|jgi:hypothetical protein|nr:hypothetical protein [archaeon]